MEELVWYSMGMMLYKIVERGVRQGWRSGDGDGSESAGQCRQCSGNYVRRMGQRDVCGGGSGERVDMGVVEWNGNYDGIDANGGGSGMMVTVLKNAYQEKKLQKCWQKYVYSGVGIGIEMGVKANYNEVIRGGAEAMVELE